MQSEAGKLALSPGRISTTSGMLAAALSPAAKGTGRGPVRALHNSTMSSMGGNEAHLTSPHHRTLVLEEFHQ